MNKDLVIYPVGKEVVVDISDERIRLPESGIVIAIDFFFTDEQYVYSMKSTYKKKGKKTVSVDYYYGADI